MKILLLSSLPPPTGGISSWTVNYQDYCKKRDIDLYIVNTSVVGNRVKKITNKKSVFSEIKRLHNILKSLKKNLKDNKIDIVHINSACTKLSLIRDYLCAKIIRKSKLPLVLHCHCNIEDQINGERLATKYFNKVAQLSNKILTINKASYNYANNIANGKVEIVPNFIQENKGDKIEKINNNLSNIVFVGHVIKAKGIYELLQVATCFPELNFDLYGTIIDQSYVIDAPSNVKFMQNLPQNELISALKNYDLFLFPTYSEGFSIALMEAMSVGLPVIATRVGANADMIEDKGGIIVEPKNVQAIIDAVEVMKDSSFRQSCSNFNKNKVETCYKREIVLENILEIYERVIKSYDL